MIFTLFLIPLAVMGQCGTNALNATDVDGNSYTSLKIGPHCWMQFNLKTKAEGSFIYQSDMYPDTIANLDIYGRLYSWYTAMNVQPGQTPVVGEHNFVQGICPEGWHLPNDVEVTQLMTNTAPTLHDVQYWLVPGTNTTTYTMRPGGYYNANKDYGENLCGNSFMWTAQSLDESQPTIVWSDCHCDFILVDKATAHDGMSVRCVYKIYEGKVTTDSAQEVTNNAATLYGTVVFNGYDESYERGFVYGTAPANMDNQAVESASASDEGSYRKEIEGLTSGTKYYYRAYVVNDFDTVFGLTKTFTTKVMDVTTDNATAITKSSVTLHGTVTHLPVSGVAHAGFKYGTDANVLNAIVANSEAMMTAGSYSCDVTGLTANLNYYYKAFVSDGTDTVYGEVKSFTSGNMDVNTDSVSSITMKSATLHGTLIRIDGLAVSTGFKYGTSESALTSIVTRSEAVTAMGSYNCDLGNLSSNTTYYYKAFAANGSDTVYGEVKNFTTGNMVVTTDSVNTITYNSAKLYGNVTDMGGMTTLSAGFKYGTSESALTSIVTRSEAVTATGSYNCDLGNLSSNTTYYYKAFVANGSDTVYGEVKNFTTENMVVTTDSVNTITYNSAKLYGNVTDMGGMSTLSAGFKYGTSESALTSIVTRSEAITATGSYSCDLGNLSSNTTYYYKAFAANGSDTVYGEVKNFTTENMVVTTDSVNTITYNSAKLYGNVTDMGGMTTLNAGFKYGTSESALTSVVTRSEAVTATGSYNCDLSNFSSNTTYYYKAFVANGSDTVYGEVKNFTTGNMVVTTDSASTITYNSAKLYGNVTDMGGMSTLNAGFKYGTSESALTSIVTRSEAVTATGSYNCDLSNFSSNTTYYYKAFVANGSDTVYGEVKNLIMIIDTVKFVANGGTVTVAHQTAVRDMAIAIKTNATHGGNWEFLSWNDACDGSGTSYGVSDSITTSGNITLYAQWHTWCTGAPHTNESGTSRIDSVKDHQGHWYKVVEIGTGANTQCWLKENMRATTRPNGTNILEKPANSFSFSAPRAYYYGDNTDNYAKYGCMYNWPATMNISDQSMSFTHPHRGICPEGWHVPVNEEWSQLAANAGIAETGSGKLADICSWNASTLPTAPGNTNYLYCDSTGFSARPAGSYNGTEFSNAGNTAYFWSATTITDETAYYPHFSNLYEKIYNAGVYRLCAFSLRCVRDDFGIILESVVKTDSTASTLGIQTEYTGYKTVTSATVCAYADAECTIPAGTCATNVAFASSPITGTITGLEPGTQYYVKVTATVAGDTETLVGGPFGTEFVPVDTIAFVPNGGTGTMNTMFVTRGVDTVLNANGYAHDGNWNFIGWNTAADGTGTAYANQDSITTSGNVTLYAQWHTWCNGTPKTSVNEFGTDRIDSLKDIDNNIYEVVQIGTQCWMAENLRTTKYADGTSISLGSSTSTTTAYRYFPNSDTTKVATYGHLYNWLAVMGTSSSSDSNPSGVQDICPTGWRVPRDAEWTQLTTYVKSQPEYVCEGCSGDDDEWTTNCIAKVLASTSGWSDDATTCGVGNNPSGNNATGFSAVPAGDYYGSYGNFGNYAYFWSATQYDNTNAYIRYLGYYDAYVGRNNNKKYFGYSVRCVRNVFTVTTDSANTITYNSAKLYGNVTSMSSYTTVNAGFKYGTSESALDSIVTKSEAVTATGSYNCDLGNLSSNTTYYYKTFAANGTDTTWGAVKNFTTSAEPFICGTFTVTDYDNNSYNTVQIGQQCWMAENLRTTKYADGTSISLGSTTSYDVAYRYNPNNKSVNVSAYGYLYNWKAVMGNTSSSSSPRVQGICPTDWHVPSDAEWTQLTTYVKSQPQYVCKECSGTDDGWATYCIAKALASTTKWSSYHLTCCVGDTSSGNNLTGFSAVPAGRFDGTYTNLSYGAYFWSATQYNKTTAYYRYLNHDYNDVHRGSQNKDFGFSVRCLRNPLTVTTDSANTITYNSAKLYSNVTSMVSYTTVNVGFKYGISESALDSIVTKSEAVTATGSYSCELTGLTDNTQYYYKAFAANGTDTAWGAVKNFTTAAEPFICGTSTVTDYDNNTYNTVQIGNQCWMAENLRTKHYSDGTEIDSGSTTSYDVAYRYNPANNSGNVSTYGYLYNWPAVMGNSSSSSSNPSGVQGICPTDWHVPSDAEWTQLTTYVGSQSEYVCNGSSSNIAKALASTSGWKTSPNNCAVGNNPSDNNATGFSVVPAGMFDATYDGGTCIGFGISADFWSATMCNSDGAYVSSLNWNYATVIHYGLVMGHGYSVRCVKDFEPKNVTTDSANTINKNSVTLYGNVTSMGPYTTMNAGFKYGTSESALDSIVTRSEAVTATGSYSCELTGLTDNNPYYYKAFAANGTDTVWGAVKKFTTAICGTFTVTDYDNNSYNTVQIGQQCWMVENLRTKHYSDGTEIDSGSTTSYDVAYRYNPNNKSVNVSAYGYLYNWKAVMGNTSSSSSSPWVQGICPTDWHVPSDAEWTQLTTYVKSQPQYVCKECSGTDDGWATYCIAKALASTTGWKTYTYSITCCVGDTSSGNNLTGFSAVPAGRFDGTYTNLSSGAYFWSATQYDNTTAYYRYLDYDYAEARRSSQNKYFGFSVRCLRDPLTVTTDSANTITYNSAKLYGNVISMGLNTEVNAGFKYGTSESALDSIVTRSEAVTAAGSYSCDLTGLTANTQYYYKAFAANGTDTAWGAVKNFTTAVAPFICGTSTVTDCDDNSYNTVLIGNQCWMAENLRTTKYADGTPIALGSSRSTTTAYRYFPNNDTNKVATYGYLYNWPAVMGNSSSSESNPSGVQGICPDGWHVPSDAEWTQLTTYVKSQPQYVCEGCSGDDGDQYTHCIAKALASTSGWGNYYLTCSVGNNQSGNNATGFSAVPAGDYTGDYDSGYDAFFWTATQYHSTDGGIISYAHHLEYRFTKVERYVYFMDYGFSVRCVRKFEPLTVTTDSANNVSKNSVTLHGNVKYLGKYTSVNAGFKYGTSESALDSIVTKNKAVTAAGSYSCDLTGLTANTQYYYKAFAANGTDTVWGAVKNFTTFTCGISTVTDYDKNTYNTLQIGTQCWMAENLRTTHYADGTSIALGSSTSTETAYRYYPNNSGNVSTYGYLYNWKAVMGNSSSSESNPSGVQGICPTGWHVPSDAEWTQLTTYVKSQPEYVCKGCSGTDDKWTTNCIAKALASTMGWSTSSSTCAAGNNPSGNNATGFSAVPAGYYYLGGYSGFGNYTSFWSATQNTSYFAYFRSFDYNTANVGRHDDGKIIGFSVRCVRN